MEDYYDTQTINQSLEIASLPDEEVIIQLDSTASFQVHNGSLRLNGLTFRHSSSRQYSILDGAEAMIEFRSEGGDLFIQDCMFDMGTNAALAHSSRVSGVFLKQGRLARIEGNKFVGGGGSALTVLNDPTLCFSRVEINRNVFINTGQPSFSETRTTSRYSITLQEWCWKRFRCRGMK